VTEDHTQLQALMLTEDWSERRALQDPEAHGVLYSLGVAAGPPAPDALTGDYVRSGALAATDVVLVDSDGAWGAQPEPDELATVLDGGAVTDPKIIAERLVDRALAAGGDDNITVAVVSCAPAEPPQGLPIPPAALPDAELARYRTLAEHYEAARTVLRELASGEPLAEPDLLTAKDRYGEHLRMLLDSGAAVETVVALDIAARAYHELAGGVDEIRTRWDTPAQRSDTWSDDDSDHLAALSALAVAGARVRELRLGEVAAIVRGDELSAELISATRDHARAAQDLETVRRWIGDNETAGRTEIPPGLRPAHRAIRAGVHSARGAVHELAGALSVDVELLLGDGYRATLAALTGESANRQGDRARLIEQLRYVVEGFHRAQDRLRALEERIDAHGGGVDSVRAQPRPAVADSDAGYSTAQYRRAAQRWRVISASARTAEDFRAAWAWTDHNTQLALRAAMPGVLAEVDGLPLDVRDEAMRLSLRRLADRAATTPDGATGDAAAVGFWTDLATAAERWAAQVAGHPEVSLLGTNGTLMVIGDLAGAEEVRVHLVHRESADAGTAVQQAVAAAVADTAARDRPTATVVWLGTDGNTLARDVAGLLPVRGGASAPDVVLVRHDSETARPDPGENAAPGDLTDLVRAAENDEALSGRAARIVVADPEQGVAPWQQSHSVDSLATNCFPEAARVALQRAIDARTREPGVDPDNDPMLADLRQRLALFELIGMPPHGMDGALGAQLLGADWNPEGFASFDDLLAAVPAEGGTMVATVAFEGFQRRGVVGAHAVAVYREGGRVLVREPGRMPQDFATWRQGMAGVVGWHGIVVEPDGTAAVALDDEGMSRGRSGAAFPVAAIGARRDRAGPETAAVGTVSDVADIGPLLTQLISEAQATTPSLRTSVRLHFTAQRREAPADLWVPGSRARAAWNDELAEARRWPTICSSTRNSRT
jgi:hypothetical protein